MTTYTSAQIENRKLLLDYLYQSHTSHIGSSLSVIDIIAAIYDQKNRNEKFILSNGHAASALYTILYQHKIIKKLDSSQLGTHPDKRIPGVDVSTGSLGQGLPIATGMAIANKNKRVYCLISDGECTEGSIWESLRIINKLNLNNLTILLSANGWGAYDPIDLKQLKKQLKGFSFNLVEIDGHSPTQIKEAIKNKYSKPTIIFANTNSEQFSFLNGLDSHYYVMNENDYQLALKELYD